MLVVRVDGRRFDSQMHVMFVILTCCWCMKKIAFESLRVMLIGKCFASHSNVGCFEMGRRHWRRSGITRQSDRKEVVL